LHGGRLKRIEDRVGNQIQFVYSRDIPENGLRLSKIVDTLGREIVVEYNKEGFIKKITDFSGRSVEYKYHLGEGIYWPLPNEGNPEYGQLREVLLPEVVGSGYQNDYSGENRRSLKYFYEETHGNDLVKHSLKKIKDSKGQVFVENTYSPETDCSAFMFGRVISQTYGNGTFHFNYVENPTLPPVGAESAKLLVIENDRKGYVTESYYNKQGNELLTRHYTGSAVSGFTTLSENRPIEALRNSDPAYFETRYEYNEDGLLKKIVHPEGNQEILEYDSGMVGGELIRRRQNKVIESRVVDKTDENKRLITTMRYESVFHQLESVMDPKGNETSYVYTSDKGLLKEIHHPVVTQGLAVNVYGVQSAVDEFEYNSFGQLTRSIDGENKVTSYEYYAQSSPSSGSSGAGGYLKSVIVDPSGLALTSTFVYDSVGNRIEFLDPKGNLYSYTVNAHNQVVRTLSPQMTRFPADGGASYETITWYDANGNVQKVWNELENSLNDGDANVTGFESANHFETQFTYDKLDNVLTVKKEVMNHAEMAPYVFNKYTYDKNENVIKVEYSDDPEPEADTFKYDERDLLFREVAGSKDPIPSITRYDYTANGRSERVFNPSSENKVIYEYDGFDRVRELRNAIQTKVIYGYDDNSNVESVTVRGSAYSGGPSIVLSKTVNFYDERDRSYRSKFVNHDIARNQELESYFDKVGYLKNNQVFRTVNRNNNPTHYLYDGANRLKEMKDAFNNRKVLSYDENSNVILTQSFERNANNQQIGVFNTLSRYDELNRVRETEDDQQNIHYLNLDSRGLVTLSMNAELHIEQMRYDGLGRPIQKRIEVESGFIPQDKIYDKRSRLIKSIDGNNKVTRYFYDGQNRLKERINADGSVRGYEYDTEGNLLFLTRENGHRIQRIYDSINRVKEVLYKNSSGTLQLHDEFFYNGLSHLIFSETKMSAPGVNQGSKLSYETDSRGLALFSSQQIWDSEHGVYLPLKGFNSSYDPLGNPLSMDYSSGRSLSFEEYNKLELPTQIKTQGFDSAISGQHNLAEYEFLGYGRLWKRTMNQGNVLNLAYDSIKRPAVLQHTLNGQVPLEFRNSYNRVHSKTAEETVDQTNGLHSVRVYQMDPYERVIGHIKNLPPSLKATALQNFSAITPNDGDDHQSVVYDHSNNIQSAQVNGTARTFSSNNMNETTNISGLRSNITHDSVGRLESYYEGTNLVEHEWNGRDQLVAVYKNNVAIARYDYYPGSTPMRSLKARAGGKTESFYGFGDNVHEIYEVSESGVEELQPRKEFVYQSIDTPIAVFTDADRNPNTGSILGREAYFYHANTRGNVHAISNESNQIVRRYDYTLSGQVQELNAQHLPDAVLTVPSGSETLALTGTPYTFTTGIHNVFGDGTLSVDFLASTGSADASLAVVEFEALTEIEARQFEAQGTISGLTGEGTLTLSLTYSEPSLTLSSTFILTLVPNAFAVSLSFEPRSSLKFVIGSPQLSVQSSASLTGGIYELIPNAGDTEGIFSEIDTSTGEFTFSQATTPGLASAEIRYTHSGETLSVTYVIEVIPADLIKEVAKPFLYGGAFQDDETGYIWMRHRFYDPVLRSFLSRDPKEDDSLGNLYAAFENNSGKYKDPMGLDVWIEAAHEKEVRGHLSLCVGNPMSKNYFSITFGKEDETNPKIYQDFSQKGEIYLDYYLKTTESNDEIIERGLRQLLGKTGDYRVMYNQCRKFSFENFKLLEKFGERLSLDEVDKINSEKKKAGLLEPNVKDVGQWILALQTTNVVAGGTATALVWKASAYATNATPQGRIALTAITALTYFGVQAKFFGGYDPTIENPPTIHKRYTKQLQEYKKPRKPPELWDISHKKLKVLEVYKLNYPYELNDKDELNSESDDDYKNK
jgi:RHS repeat-associated protein